MRTSHPHPHRKAGHWISKSGESGFQADKCPEEPLLPEGHRHACLITAAALSPDGAVPLVAVKSMTAEAEKTWGQTGPVRTLGGFLA